MRQHAAAAADDASIHDDFRDNTTMITLLTPSLCTGRGVRLGAAVQRPGHAGVPVPVAAQRGAAAARAAAASARRRLRRARRLRGGSAARVGSSRGSERHRDMGWNSGWTEAGGRGMAGGRCGAARKSGTQCSGGSCAAAVLQRRGSARPAGLNKTAHTGCRAGGWGGSDLTDGEASGRARGSYVAQRWRCGERGLGSMSGEG